MAWRIECERKAEKELNRIDKQQAKRILKYLFNRLATKKDQRMLGVALRYNLQG